MAAFQFTRLIHQLSILVLALVLLTNGSPLEKRATQVSLISYTFSNNVLAGSINVSLTFPILSPILEVALLANLSSVRYKILPTQKL